MRHTVMQWNAIRLAILTLGCLTCALAVEPAGEPSTPAASRVFIHPGGLHTREDLERMKAKVAERATPWIDGWNRLIEDPKASSGYRAAPNPTMPSRQRAQDDARAAYLNALRWYISGDPAHGQCAVRILNGWSAAITGSDQHPGERGLSGIPIGSFALAAEVLRTYPDWAEADQTRCKRMLVEFLYPLAHDFLTTHNGRHNDSFWANWDMCNILALIAIGVYCDNTAIFDEGIAYYRHGQGMGALQHAVPFLYPDGLGQWQESGRDHAHALGGMGLAAELCQVAWNQGIDLFGEADNRLLAGAEYEAQFTQWIGVPYTFYTNSDAANQYYISQNYHGRLGNCQYFELIYNHYVVRKGLRAPQTTAFAALLRPEGGNADLMGYGTLTCTLDAAASPFPAAPPVPQEVVAVAGMERVMLHWSPSGAYATSGYDVFRATASGGPYTRIFTTDWNTTPAYTDAQVEAGKRYFYAVAATNHAGSSRQSAEVSAVPVRASPLPAPWREVRLANPGENGTCTAAETSVGTTLRLSAGAGDLGGTADSAYLVHKQVHGDVTITARLCELGGQLNKVGLVLRAQASPGAKGVALTLGDAGGRQTRFMTRDGVGARPSTQRGNDYVWPIAWFRIQRTGNTCIASQSSDGITWFTCGTSTLDLGPDCQIGFAIGSQGAGKQASAIFDHVRIERTPPSPPTVPAAVTATPVVGGIRLAWRPSVEGSKSEGWKVECARDGGGFYEVSDLSDTAQAFLNTGLAQRSYSYRIRAYNTGGYSPYSSVVVSRPLPETPEAAGK